MIRLSALVLVATALASSVAFAAPADDAVKAYRDYVAAIRAGSSDNVLKLVETVPESSKPLLVAAVQSLIDVEAVKTEMAKQMGPEPTDEQEGWNMGQLPDRILKDVKGEARADGTVTLSARDPQGDSFFPIGIMVRQGDKWVVPAGTALGLEPSPKFEEPAEAERPLLLKQANAVSAGAKSVLERLKKKEFKSPEEVQSALVAAMATAG